MNYFQFNVEGSPLLPPAIITDYFIIFSLILFIAYLIFAKRRQPVLLWHKFKLLIVIAAVLKVIVITGIVLLAIYWFIPNPKVSQTTPQATSINTSTVSNIEVIFDRPVNRKLLEKAIVPEVPGVWVFEDSVYSTHIYRKLVFHPTESLQPDTNYTITLSNIQNVSSLTKPYNYSFQFKTQPAPKVVSIIPNKNNDPAEINTEIKVILDQPNDQISQFDFTFTPQVEFDQSLDTTKKVYTLKPKQPLKQGTSYQLEINKSNVIWNLADNQIVRRTNITDTFQSVFKTKEAPGIVSFTPTGVNNLLNSVIDIQFSHLMDRQSVEKNFKIEPKINGIFSWKNDKEVYFKPAGLSYETNYTITIQKGTKELNGAGFLENDSVNTFSTIGSVKVVSFTPGNNLGGISINSPIKVTFDQEVDKLSAQAHFSLSPTVAGGFSWNGNTMIFTPTSSYPYSTKHTITISAGIKSKIGLDSKKSFSSNFTTQDQTFKLAVPAWLQKYSLSCEIASLRMALAYKGASLNEDEIIAKVGQDPTPHTGNVWGNPYNAFVGKINGRQMVDGYGVYWPAIEKAAKNYRNAQAFQGWQIADLTREIAAGNPIVIWVYSSSGAPTYWYTPDNQKIFAVAGEHAVVAVGFVGPASNPSQMIINDPLIGQVYWPRSLFDTKWNTFSHAGVVVY